MQEATGSSGTLRAHPDWTVTVRSDPSPDLIFSAKDAITFHVQRARILGASVNGFDGKVSFPLSQGPDSKDAKIQPTIQLPYSSTVVNLLLHAVYEEGGRLQIHDIVFSESLTDLSSTIHALEECGIPLETSISESSMLYDMLSSHCQQSALDVYSLAASHAPYLHHLAMYASSFLLTLEFSEITEEMAAKIGSIYLLRLYRFLSERTREFKRILHSPPEFHVPDQHCNTKSLEKAWRLAIAYLLCSAAPDVPTACMDGTRNSVIDQVSCERCKASLEQRFDDLKNTWSLVKVRFLYSSCRPS